MPGGKPTTDSFPLVGGFLSVVVPKGRLGPMPFKALFSSVFAGRLQMELRDEKIRKQCGGRLKKTPSRCFFCSVCLYVNYYFLRSFVQTINLNEYGRKIHY